MREDAAVWLVGWTLVVRGGVRQEVGYRKQIVSHLLLFIVSLLLYINQVLNRFFQNLHRFFFLRFQHLFDMVQL